MREIKFRKFGKHTDGTFRMVDWTILNASSAVDFRCDEGEKFMQYTGLKDKNGKEIYEGDVVRSDRHRTVCKIVFQYGAFRFDLGTKKYAVEIECEVIGNIYENPELLT